MLRGICAVFVVVVAVDTAYGRGELFLDKFLRNKLTEGVINAEGSGLPKGGKKGGDDANALAESCKPEEVFRRGGVAVEFRIGNLASAARRSVKKLASIIPPDAQYVSCDAFFCKDLGFKMVACAVRPVNWNI